MKKYSDIIPSYGDYFQAQKETFCSFESTSIQYLQGQERYIKENFENLDRSINICDAACGDGVGLRFFKSMGFRNVTGIEINPEKAVMASKSGYPVFVKDLSNLYGITPDTFDLVYTSHTLEHTYSPKAATQNLTRILKPGGFLYVVLPYPDLGPDEAHGGKYELGTTIPDGGQTVCSLFCDIGYTVLSAKFDNFREEEIWIVLKKM